MEQHPIQGLMGTSMESIREMVDVNTVVGDPVQTQDGSTIIPISKVSFGFVAGGGEYAGGLPQPQPEELPFAGGAGAGVSVQPMGFLVCSASGVRLLSASCASPLERVVEMIPQAIESLRTMEKEEAEGKSTRPRVSAAYQEGGGSGGAIRRFCIAKAEDAVNAPGRRFIGWQGERSAVKSSLKRRTFWDYLSKKRFFSGLYTKGS